MKETEGIVITPLKWTARGNWTAVQ